MYTPGATWADPADPQLVRPRGDRRGFEPLWCEGLDLPRLPPRIRWRSTLGIVGLQTDTAGPLECSAVGPVPDVALWTGDPVEVLHVVGPGGLGDWLRTLPLAAAGVRSGRVRSVVLHRNRGEALPFLHPEPLAEAPSDGSAAVLPLVHHTAANVFKVGGPAVGPLVLLAGAALGLQARDVAGPVLDIPRATVERVAALLAARGWTTTGGPLVLVQADRGRGTPSDTLPNRVKVPAAMPAVADALRQAGAWPLLIGAGPADRADVHDGRGCSLADLAALVWLADLVIAPCSGPLHLAGAIGTPAIGLFGPTDPNMNVCAAGTAPMRANRDGCPIAPCAAGDPGVRVTRGGGCPVGRFGACMELDPERVARVAMRLIARATA